MLVVVGEQKFKNECVILIPENQVLFVGNNFECEALHAPLSYFSQTCNL